MMTDIKIRSRRPVIFGLFVLAAITAVFVLPFQLRSSASKGLFPRTESHDTDLPNYDIRTDKAAINKLAAFRAVQNKTASQVADIRDGFVRGEAVWKQRLPD